MVGTGGYSELKKRGKEGHDAAFWGAWVLVLTEGLPSLRLSVLVIWVFAFFVLLLLLTVFEALFVIKSVF